jgi:DNA-binding GntR family transcriptional regulator
MDALENHCQLYTVDNMNPVSIRRQTLADQVFDRAVEAIVSGEIEDGGPISEIEIAERFGVSRGPAREAIFRLESKGLVTRTAHLGARVVALTLEDLRSLYEMREALECKATRLAASRITDQDLVTMAMILERDAQNTEVSSGKSYYQLGTDDDFHVQIIRASGNMRIERALCDELYDVLRLYRFRSSLSQGRASTAWDEHQAILEALKARDPDRAEQAMRHHIHTSWHNNAKSFDISGQ